MSGTGRVRPPSWRLQLLEPIAWSVETAAFVSSLPLFAAARTGDQHPVLFLPGFTAGDGSTAPLRSVVRSHGYWVHAWRLGRNIGPTARAVSGMRARMAELYDTHQRRVTLIGQSLGGIYARLLARERPELVRQVITLGSPYRMVAGDRSTATLLWRRYEHLHDGDLPLSDVGEQDRVPLAVPATSIYSRSDGVAPWQTCIDIVRKDAENIEVVSSHVGMAVNPAVVLAVLDCLARREDEWRPFEPPAALCAWYPKPASWRERQEVR
jgi:pimeloyl-ACP methyl ester carboxylesterase